jgi:hypothetical protein
MAWLHDPPYTDADSQLSLGQRRELLAECLYKLLAHAWQLGYTVRIGEVVRDPRVAALNAKTGAGIANSLHIDGLAVDLLLFKDGKYLTQTEDYTPLGTYWESLHPLCRWGGRFTSRPDGNHFSITWQGRA